jgi:hypothetical protein
MQDQFADKAAYEQGTLRCRKCAGDKFHWEGSNLWCDNCGELQRV